MSMLNSFSPNANVAVVGSTGGIGSEFVQQLAADERVGRVFALSRRDSSITGPKIRNLHIDFELESSIETSAAAIGDDEPLDAVIVATGLLHDDEIRPEKRLQDLDPAAIQRAFAINAIGPSLVAKHLLPKMRKQGKSVFAAISARVGSIGDNRLGGWASYRASKAALNMLLKTAAIEHRRRFPESIVVGLHPGTVDTNLSAPFRRNVPDDKLFSPHYSVARLLAVIDGLETSDSGNTFAWDGQAIPF